MDCSFCCIDVKNEGELIKLNYPNIISERNDLLAIHSLLSTNRDEESVDVAAGILYKIRYCEDYDNNGWRGCMIADNTPSYILMLALNAGPNGNYLDDRTDDQIGNTLAHEMLHCAGHLAHINHPDHLLAKLGWGSNDVCVADCASNFMNYGRFPPKPTGVGPAVDPNEPCPQPIQ